MEQHAMSEQKPESQPEQVQVAVAEPASASAEARGVRRRILALLARLRWEWIVPILVGLLSLALNLHMLGTISAWYDETLSFAIVNRPLDDMWHIIWGQIPNMELYFILLYQWLHVTAALGLHPTEFVLRLPSALFGAMSAVVVLQLGRRFWGWTAGIVAALLFLLNPLQIYYAQEIRAYSLQVLLVCLSWYALLVALAERERRTRWWLAYAIMSSLAVYAQLFSGLVLLAQTATVLAYCLLPGPWRTSARRSLRAFALAQACVVVSLIPLGPVARQGGGNDWVPPAALRHLYTFLRVSVSGGSLLFLALLVAGVLLALAAAAAWFVSRLAASRVPGISSIAPAARERAARVYAHTLQQPAPGILALLAWLVVPVVLAYAVTQPSLNLHVFLDRYLGVIIAALCLLVGVGIAAIRAQPARVAVALLVLALALPQTAGYYAQQNTQGWRALSQWVQQRYQPGDDIACYPDTFCTFPMRYYLAAYPGAAHWDYAAPQSTTDPAALAAFAAKHPHIFLIQAVFSPSATALSELRAVQAFMDSHYQLLGQFSTSHMDYQFKGRDLVTSESVRLYATGATGAAAAPGAGAALSGQHEASAGLADTRDSESRIPRVADAGKPWRGRRLFLNG